jgi:DNA gyrase/topoisomerase IV subunit B
MGFGNRVVLNIQGPQVTVRDFGRGIPLGKIIDCVSRINTGAKYNNEVFQFSVGLNGVGTKAVNALSSRFTVQSFRSGKYALARFEQGVLQQQKKGKAPEEPDGTLICFTPDPEIFGEVDFNEEHLKRRIRLYAYLNSGLEIHCNDIVYHSENGLKDLVGEDVEDEALYPPLYHKSKTLELALTHTNRYSETYFSFVNGQFTGDGGTHLSAFREGVLKAVNEFSKKKFSGEEVRDGLVGAVAIRIQDPVFESQTKNKLGNTEIRSGLVNDIREIVNDLLHRYPEAAERAQVKIEETQRLRRELQAVKKMAREKARATSIRVPNLKDCTVHYNHAKDKGTESMIFLTEGQSAAGSIVSCRDVHTQAIYTLRGKPLNVCNLKRDAIYRNDELYNLMRSLNIEDNVDHLRYNRIILATDADVDGLHIRNLLLTFFLRFFETLVLRGHVYILETPLFRVRNKKETIYCYSEQERDQAVKKISRGVEVTRFKGLGEISPGEFKHFIGDRMRLQQVEVMHHHAVPQLLSFYMGKNTQQRRGYIMDHLVVDEAV